MRVPSEVSACRPGYLTREPHPHDRRARLLRLTTRGHACTRAAEGAAAETIRTWEEQLGHRDLQVLRHLMTRLAAPGPLRPAW